MGKRSSFEKNGLLQKGIEKERKTDHGGATNPYEGRVVIFYPKPKFPTGRTDQGRRLVTMRLRGAEKEKEGKPLRPVLEETHVERMGKNPKKHDKGAPTK